MKLRSATVMLCLLIPGCSGPSIGAVVAAVVVSGGVVILVVGLAMFLYREIASLRERVAKTEHRLDNDDPR